MDSHLYQSVFASFPQGICMLDTEGLILEFNPAVERLLGWRIAELRGQSLGSTLLCAIPDPACALSWNAMLSQTISTGETSYVNPPTEFLAGPDRSQRVCLVGMGAPWIGAAGQRLGTLILFLEQPALSQARPLPDGFLAVISHELGVPATSILAAAERLSSRIDPADRDTWKVVQILLAEANRLRRLLSQFLSQADPRPGIDPPEEGPVALGPLIRRVVETGRLRQSDRTLTVELPPHLPLICAEPDRILQVLNKLVDNALKYSPPGAQVVVAAHANETDVVVTVFDGGPALQEDEARRLFEPFHRGRAAQQVPGQGMGLNIARSIVRAAGGELWYEAPASGGNCFSFTLSRSGSTGAEGTP